MAQGFRGILTALSGEVVAVGSAFVTKVKMPESALELGVLANAWLVIDSPNQLCNPALRSGSEIVHLTTSLCIEANIGGLIPNQVCIHQNKRKNQVFHCRNQNVIKNSMQSFG